MGMDIYLLKKTYIGACFSGHRSIIDGDINIRKNGVIIPIELNHVLEITECIGHWRKFYSLHQWMVDNTSIDGKKCHEYPISDDIMAKLKSDCEAIISCKKNWIENAKKIFPHLQFEYATSDQLRIFLSEIHYTYQVLAAQPAATADVKYFYNMSW